MTTVNVPSLPSAKSISLHRLLDEMLGCYARVKKDHRNFFINEVPRHLSVAITKNMLAPILGDLFSIISSNPGNHCVRISAMKSGDQVTLYIKKSEIRGLCLSGIRLKAA